jgi:hypothetical protein
MPMTDYLRVLVIGSDRRLHPNGRPLLALVVHLVLAYSS